MIPILKSPPPVDPRIVGAPSIMKLNSANATKDSVVVYWVSPKGEIQLAADTRITQSQLQSWPEYRHWRRCEATGAKEIEKISLILSKQAFEKNKALKVQQHLRERSALEQAKFRCKIRVAQGHSPNDVALNKKLLQRFERNEDSLYRLVVSEFDPGSRNTALSMEVRTQSTSPLAHVGQKPTGLHG